jgi:hypothetical protein
MPSTTPSTEALQSTAFSSSFIHFPGEPPEAWIWAFPDVSLSYVIPPPPPEPDRGACYAASLAADDLLEDFRAALRDGDDLSARMALHTLVGLAKVVTGQLSGTSYVCFSNTTSEARH